MLVQLEHVRKKYGSFTLELNMQIPEVRIIGLIGANGAGKSTTFKLMLGLSARIREPWKCLAEMPRILAQRRNWRLEPCSPTVAFPNT